MDTDVKYLGPKAKVATLTGSPLWGISYEEVAERYEEWGWTLVSSLRHETPYGLGPVVQHFVTTSGRDVIRIPSYGGELGRDWDDSEVSQKLFWILWQAGVKILLIGGTSGIADWRNGNRIQPGDIVLPWSFRTSPRHRGLPGTEYETSWPKFDLTLGDPFCTDLASQIESVAMKYVKQGLIGDLHTPRDARVSLVVPDGMTFETDYDILMWNVINREISMLDPDSPPVVSLHGDCVNPVLARLLGMHVAYYHLVANVAQGLAMDESITDSLYRLYLGNFAKVSLEMEFNLLETMSLDNSCVCEGSRVLAPEIFSQSMTGGSHDS